MLPVFFTFTLSSPYLLTARREEEARAEASSGGVPEDLRSVLTLVIARAGPRTPRESMLAPILIRGRETRSPRLMSVYVCLSVCVGVERVPRFAWALGRSFVAVCGRLVSSKIHGFPIGRARIAFWTAVPHVHAFVFTR